MPAQQQNVNSNNNSWFFVSAFRWIVRQGERVFSWFFPGERTFPNNATGDLMQRTLAQKSWFDKISSSWIEQSFRNQFVIILGVTLVAGFIGLWAGASLLFTLTSLFICIGVHTLLVSHEHHRTNSAKAMAGECLALQADLEQGKELLNNLVNAVEPVASTLESETGRIKVQADGLVEEASKLTIQTEELNVVALEMLDVAKQLDGKKDALVTQQDKNLAQLNQVSPAVEHAIKKLEGVSVAAGIIHDITLEVQETHKVYSTAAARFTVFLNEKITESQQALLDNPYEASNLEVDKSIEETDLLIEQMKLSMV